MPLMEWGAALDIGVEQMNREHQDILAAINAVYDGAQAGVSGPSMMARIARLADVTQRHFVEEERYMARIGYPGLTNHKAVHAKLLEDFAVHAGKTEAAGGVPSKEFFQFLRLWLTAHIKCIDKKYGEHAAVHPKAA